MVQMNLFTDRNRITDIKKTIYGFQGTGGGGTNWEIGTDIYKLLSI